MIDNIASEQLASYIMRIEQLESEKAELSSNVRDIFNEAKNAGFDVKTMREVLKLRRMEEDQRDEHEALLETYLRALGMRDTLSA